MVLLPPSIQLQDGKRFSWSNLRSGCTPGWGNEEGYSANGVPVWLELLELKRPQDDFRVFKMHWIEILVQYNPHYDTIQIKIARNWYTLYCSYSDISILFLNESFYSCPKKFMSEGRGG